MRDPFQGYDQWKTASPYDDAPEWEDNSTVEDAFSDYTGPADLYHHVYKSTPCGPTVGVIFESEEDYEDHIGPGTVVKDCTLYCDDLYKLGTWKQIAEQGLLIEAISVSSIVEGVDQCTETHYIDCDPTELEAETIRKAFWEAVEEVDKEADEIWKATHGCPGCDKKQMEFTGRDVVFDDWGTEVEIDEDGYPLGNIPAHPDCEMCGGNGVAI